MEQYKWAYSSNTEQIHNTNRHIKEMTTIRGLKKLHILTNFQNLQISISEKLKKMERNKALLELYIALLLSKRNMYLSP